MLASFHLMLQAAIIKRIVSNKITFLFCGFEYGKINIMLILNEIFIISIVYFHFSQSKIVKQCFIELLCRMTKIRLLHMNLFFVKISRESMYWSICC